MEPKSVGAAHFKCLRDEFKHESSSLGKYKRSLQWSYGQQPRLVSCRHRARNRVDSAGLAGPALALLPPGCQQIAACRGL